MAGRYGFDFSWDSPYGLMARLLERHVPHGHLILDLGCGHGAIAEPLRDMGYEYLGCDADPVGPDSLQARGFETSPIDLTDLNGLAERLVKLTDGRTVGAVLMLDVLEHLPNPDGFLQELRLCLLQLDRPLLGLSVPNVAHFDVGAKLVMGSWDVTPSGLLDETHVQFFTERRLLALLRSVGWYEIARNDLLLHHSDQHFPADHPALADDTPLRNLLWQLRRRIGDGLTANQFVRVFGLASAEVTPGESQAGESIPFLSVLMRTQGSRMHNLLEALTCLAAQTENNFEVHLLVHTSRQQPLDEVRKLVSSFAPPFAHRVRVHQVPDGGRACPLNVGLTVAIGRYIAFLDDDDLVTADWVERFREGADSAPGQIVRSITVDRRVSRNLDERAVAPYQTLSGLLTTHNAKFNALEHFSRNRTPICSFAVPSEAVRCLGVGFDENSAVLEDWNFLLNMALVCGVHDTDFVTSVYHRWEGLENSSSTVASAVWDTTRHAILQRLDNGPLLLPSGSASQIADLWEKGLIADHQTSASSSEQAHLQAELVAARQRLSELEARERGFAEERAALEREVTLARTDAADVRNSNTWRLSLPIRRLAWLARRVIARRSLPQTGL